VRRGNLCYAVLWLVVCGVSSIAQTFSNGDMELFTVLGSGDTIPQGWGTASLKNGYTLAWDDAVFHQGAASLRMYGRSDTLLGQTSFSQRVNDITGAYGDSIQLSGFARTDSITNQAQVIIEVGCSGTGWTNMPGWVTAFFSRTAADWSSFSKKARVPTVEECTAANAARPTPTVNVRVYISGLGVIWVDDLVVTIPPTMTPIRLVGSVKLPVQISAQAVTFSQPTGYTVTLSRPNGQQVAALRGHGLTADLSRFTRSGGMFLVNVRCDIGQMSRTLICE
jgi:hypothetical protein